MADRPYLDKTGLNTFWDAIKTFVGNAVKVTGVKGDSETDYRTGNVNITKTNIGLGNVENKSSATIRGELTSSNVTTALGYTPPQSDTNTTYSLTQDSTNGHKITLTPSSGTAQTVTIPDNNTTYSAGSGLSLNGTTFSVKTGYTTSGNNRAVQADSNGNLYVTQKDDNSVTGVKGDSESSYRSGNVNITKANIGLGNVENKSSATIRGELTKSNVTTALGYTPPTSDTNTTYSLTQDASDGHKITLTPSSGTAQTVTIPDNNTWRGIQNNLTSDSTTDSLSAAQGKALANGSARDSTKLPLAGGTLTGAINTANATWNKIGDDVQIGDINEAGTLGVQGLNGNTSLRFTTYNQSTKTTGGKITWDGSNFIMTGTVDTSISGNAATATTATKLGTETVGSSNKLMYLNAGTATAGNNVVSHHGNAGKSNMNDIGRIHSSSGMTNLCDPSNTTDNPMNGTTKSTGWHLYWSTNYSDNPNGSNAWVAQICNTAGSNKWWVRSRDGGTFTNGKAWNGPWEHLVIAPQAGQGGTTTPIYVDANGHTQACSYTIAKSVPADAKFTDNNTWDALSTSKAGYVAKAPNDTGKFLRGDATWAAVTKSNVGLGNVENKSSATIRGEISSSNVTTALGFTPLNASAGLGKTTFTPTAGSSYSNYGGCYYEKYGRVVHVHVGLSGLTKDANVSVFTLPTGYRPSSTIFTYGTNGTSYDKFCYGSISTSGEIKVRSNNNTYAGIDFTYLV